MRQQQCVTITFGEVAENHVGMQKVGTMAAKGFTMEEMEAAKEEFERRGMECEMVDLVQSLPEEVRGEVEAAAVLIVRGAIASREEEMMEELLAIEWDTKALMKGRVVNKHARHNVCFDEEGQEPEYEKGKGRVVAFDSVPEVQRLRDELPEYLGESARGLKAEGNLYFDLKKCGIGFHGDSERKMVVAVRLGAQMPLHYQWFKGFKPVGERVRLMLEPGDMYVMSEKATGYDWKRSSIYTLRHAAGSEKYLTIK